MKGMKKALLLAVCMTVMSAARAWRQNRTRYDDWNNGQHGWADAQYATSAVGNMQARIDA